MLKVLLVLSALGLTVCAHAQNPKQSGAIDTSEAEPSREEFVAVDVEPEPLVPIRSLIRYPETARKQGLEGKVVTESLVEKDGSVSKVVVLKSSDDIFKEEAIRAMLSARYHPALQDGKPMRIWVTNTIHFRLSTPSPDFNSPSDTDSTSSPIDRPSRIPK